VLCPVHDTKQRSPKSTVMLSGSHASRSPDWASTQPMSRRPRTPDGQAPHWPAASPERSAGASAARASSDVPPLPGGPSARASRDAPALPPVPPRPAGPPPVPAPASKARESAGVDSEPHARPESAATNVIAVLITRNLITRSRLALTQNACRVEKRHKRQQRATPGVGDPFARHRLAQPGSAPPSLTTGTPSRARPRCRPMQLPR
jgi:hypothetical protein